ncbi:MAG: hypothetical protein ACTSP4_14065 [Candidatus Hodarchaeales archaeon]
MAYEYEYPSKEVSYTDMLLFSRVVPTIIIGLAVWLMGILVVGPELIVNNIGLFFVALIAYIVMWIWSINHTIVCLGSDDGWFRAWISNRDSIYRRSTYRRDCDGCRGLPEQTQL